MNRRPPNTAPSSNPCSDSPRPAGRPPIIVEFRPSLRLQRAWHVWCGALAAAVLAGNAAPGWLRLAVAALLADAWRRGRDWLAYPGPAGRRLIWDADGSWWLQDAGLGLRQLRLAAMPHTLGPWLWLRFRGGRGGPAGRAADLTVIDARYAEPVGLRRLQAALRLEYRSLEDEVRDA